VPFRFVRTGPAGKTRKLLAVEEVWPVMYALGGFDATRTMAALLPISCHQESYDANLVALPVEPLADKNAGRFNEYPLLGRTGYKMAL
jgi:hypothetical protein